MANKKEIKLLGNIVDPFQRFFQIEASGGIILMLFTVIALVWANSPWGDFYHHLWEHEFTFQFDGSTIKLPSTIHHWVNDGLMAIFFFVVGLEIKRELIAGELSSLKKASLPIAAAIGGMAVPAILFTVLNTDKATASGWGIPMATDIAFSLGVLSLLGKRVPVALKVFLVAFAIVDDLGAVLVIAFFYSGNIEWSFLIVALGLVLGLTTLNWLNINKVPIYVVVGFVVWYLFYRAGIHPTIAGVLIAFTIPMKRRIRRSVFRNRMQNELDTFCTAPGESGKQTLTHQQLVAIDNMEAEILRVQSPVQRLEHDLHSFVTFFVMPVFALINAGVALEGAKLSSIFSGLSGTIEVSLIAGKVIGILLFCFISVKLGLAILPDNVKWKQILGLGFLGGMGFTMSLFIANLAFVKNGDVLNPAKIGILVGSLIAGLSGYLILHFTLDKKTKQ